MLDNLADLSSTVQELADVVNVDTQGSCKELAARIDGGVVAGSGTVAGSVRMYACDEGMEMIGDKTLLCHDGKWFPGDPPTCVVPKTVNPTRSPTASPTITPPDYRIAQNGLYTWFDAEDFDAGKWPQRGGLCGAKCDVEFPENPPKPMSGGSQAHKDYKSVGGDTKSHPMNFGAVSQRDHAICTTSMYEPGGMKGRIFTACGSCGGATNWLHGHWGGNAGVSHMDTWVVFPGLFNDERRINDWLVWCSSNGHGKIFYNSKSGVKQAKLTNGKASASHHISPLCIVSIFCFGRQSIDAGTT